MSKSIEQQVTFNAPLSKVFEALVDAKQHSAFTGAPAKVTRENGAPFRCHDGMVSGRNIEVVEGTRIVQAWRAKNFPEGVYSVASFELEAVDPLKTRLTFTQHGVPDEAYDMISKGWQEHYWTKLAKYLA
jgi:activator of HSP90 ATPase